MTPLECAVALGRELTQAGIPYAIGGALAYGVYAVPRATADVDINVFIEEAELDTVVGCLASLGVDLELESARAMARADGLIVCRMDDVRLDVFVPSIDFAWEAMKTRRFIRLGDEEIAFLSSEALAVFKLLFFRPKDLIDLERLLRLQSPSDLDRDYVRAELSKIVGDDDPRVARWRDLVESVDGGIGSR